MEADGLQSARALPTWPWHVVVPVLLGLLLYVGYGGGYVGLDGMWSLVWGRDIVHAAPLAVSQTTTPHVLSNLLGALLTPLGPDADHGLIAIEFWAAGGLVWASALLAFEIAGIAPAIATGAIVVLREPLLYATTSAFLDVFVAVFVVWAAVLIVRRGVQRPGLPMVLLLFAGLLRPEPWVIAGAFWLWRIRSRGGPAIVHGLTVLAAPVSWLVVDRVFSGDALFSVHTTNRIEGLIHRGNHISSSLFHRVIDGPKNIAHAAGVDLFVIAFVAALILLIPQVARMRWARLAAPTDERRAPLLVLLWGSVIYGSVIFAEGLVGGLTYTRFALPILSAAAAIVTVMMGWAGERFAGEVGRPRARRIYAVIVAVLLVIQVPSMISARDKTTSEHARYSAARAAIRPGVPCTPAVTPNTNFRAYVASWADLRGDQVIDGATHPIPPTGTYVTATGGTPELLLRDHVFPQRASLPPAPVLRSHDGWLLTSRCPR